MLEPSTQYENYNINTVVIDVINIRCIVFHSIIGGEEERTRGRGKEEEERRRGSACDERLNLSFESK